MYLQAQDPASCFAHAFLFHSSMPVVPKLGVNYPLGVICGTSGGNVEPKRQICSVLWAITWKEIFDIKCEKFLLRVIRHNLYLHLGKDSKKFGNHWGMLYNKGGQTAAREPHVALRTFACGSLSIPKNYIFGSGYTYASGSWNRKLI